MKKDIDMVIDLAGLTDKGRTRERNEDAFYCKRNNQGQVLAVVVDGCGGHQGGDVCSRIVVDEMRRWFETHKPVDCKACLKGAVVHTNDKVLNTKKENPELEDMCAVMTAVITDPEKNLIHMVHVGDSRLYAYLDGRLVKLSHDHSPVGELEDKGYLTEEEAMNHINRNKIRRAIGSKQFTMDSEYLECKTFPMAPGMGWLLCSDGLTDMITSSRIGEILDEPIPLGHRAIKLVDAANEAGGKDNITVVLLQDMNVPDNTTQEIFLSYGKPLGKEIASSSQTDNDGVILELVDTPVLEEPKPDKSKKFMGRLKWIYVFAALVFLLCSLTVCLIVQQKMEQYQQQELYWQNQEVLKSLYYNISNR